MSKLNLTSIYKISLALNLVNRIMAALQDGIPISCSKSTELEKYLYSINIYNHSKALAKLRYLNHKLAIERLMNTINCENRYCKYSLNNIYIMYLLWEISTTFQVILRYCINIALFIHFNF